MQWQMYSPARSHADVTGSGTEIGHNHMNLVYNSNNKKSACVYVCVCAPPRKYDLDFITLYYIVLYLCFLYTIRKV